MAHSTTPLIDEVSATLQALPLTTTQAPQRVAVAYSGGRDSTALLHATAMAAKANGCCHVVALHVHHGLSAHADGWLAHAQQQCERWVQQGLPITLRWRHVDCHGAAGQSVEALARTQRYAALTDMAHEAACDVVLLAHHRQDQAETFLLQALRGAGVAGLSAMPSSIVRDDITWARPWLQHSSQAIAHYIQTHGLTHIDDDSNADTRWARNRLRHAVWPHFQAAFDACETSLAQSAAHLADVQSCLTAWLSLQWPEVTQPSEDDAGKHVLLVAQWRAYAPGPQRELLRAWFKHEVACALPMTWVVRLQNDMMLDRPARWPLVLKRAGRATVAGHVALYRGRVSWHADTDAADTALAEQTPHTAQSPAVPVSIHAVGLYPLAEANGALLIKPVLQGGVALERLHLCELRPRQGGEQFQRAVNQPARSLKKQFQSMGIAAWARHAPLLWAGNDLVYVPGLGIDARALALPEQMQVSIEWLAQT